MANHTELELPSNRKFGFFFSLVFSGSSLIVFLFLENSEITSLILLFLAFLFAFLAICKADVLLPLNEGWMSIGLMVGKIVSPLVLGLLFFLVFTPIGILTRLFGRDELRLRITKSKSYWVERNLETSADESFKNQF